MYLYDKVDGKINIYSIVPNIQRIHEYREWYIGSVPVTKRIFFAESDNRSTLLDSPDLKRFDFNGIQVDKIKTVSENEINTRRGVFSSKFHVLKSYDMVGFEYDRQEEIIEQYCNGTLPDSRIVVVQSRDKKQTLRTLRYLLVTGHYYFCLDDDCYLGNIISIPRQLFLLEWCLCGGSFDCLDDMEFSEIIRLFDISSDSVVTLDYDQLLKCGDYGLFVDDSIMTNIDSKINASKGTLRRIREKNKSL